MNYVYMSDIRDSYEYPDYLAHHGIKGQKWGVRRFQTLSGALTAAGRSRYGSKVMNSIKRLNYGMQGATARNVADYAAKGLASAAKKSGNFAQKAKAKANEALNKYADKGDSVLAENNVYGRARNASLKAKNFKAALASMGVDASLKAAVTAQGAKHMLSEKAQDFILDAGVKGESAYLKFKKKAGDLKVDAAINAMDAGEKFMKSSTVKAASTKLQDIALSGMIAANTASNKAQDAYLNAKIATEPAKNKLQDVALNAAVKAIDTKADMQRKSYMQDYVRNTNALKNQTAGSSFISAFNDTSLTNLSSSNPHIYDNTIDSRHW